MRRKKKLRKEQDTEDDERIFQKLQTIVEQGVHGVERRLRDLVTELAAKQGRSRSSSRGRERRKETTRRAEDAGPGRGQKW